MQNLNILLLIVLVFISCQSGETEKLVTIESKYTISIPSFLVKSDKLNEDASLQYMHAWKELYVIVIDESESETHKILADNKLTDSFSTDIKGYSDLILLGFEQTVAISEKSKIIDTLINNMPARVLTFTGQADGIDAFYSLAFIKGKETYYQIMTWTLSSKASEYKDKMNRIIYSLKEI